MGRAVKHHTEEERRAAAKKSSQKYNSTHLEERAAHNREYVQRHIVKERIKARRLARKNARAQEARSVSEERNPGRSKSIQYITECLRFVPIAELCPRIRPRPAPISA